MMTYRGVEVNGQRHDPLALPSRKEPPIPTEEETGWTPEASGRCGLETNILPYRESKPGRPSGIPQLYRLSYPG
jgi:hypothetical protein